MVSWWRIGPRLTAQQDCVCVSAPAALLLCTANANAGSLQDSEVGAHNVPSGAYPVLRSAYVTSW
jgi:hypothetical protein